jgi:hypothetical protein
MNNQFNYTMGNTKITVTTDQTGDFLEILESLIKAIRENKALEVDEVKPGKGWLELSKEVPVYQAGPIKWEDLVKLIKELMRDKPSTNDGDNWTPSQQEMYDKLIKEEAELFKNFYLDK